MAIQPLPISVDNFEKIIIDNYYYVDKTLWTKELIDKKAESPSSCVHAVSIKRST